MRYTYLRIKNFKSIRDMEIADIDNALILVGRNNTGKSVALDAIRAISGDYRVKEADFHSQSGNITISARLRLYEEDLENLHSRGLVSNFKNYEYWISDFCRKLPSYDAQTGLLTFEYVYGRNGKICFRDGISKNNEYISLVVPKIYFVDHFRSNVDLKHDLIELGQDSGLGRLQENECIFDSTRKCNQCFECIGLINKKKPEDLTLLETARLLQYKLVSVNLNDFASKVNESFEKNGALSERVRYELKFDSDEVFNIVTMISNKDRGIEQEINELGEGLRSIYILSLLETYAGTDNIVPHIIMIEEPEMFLHPQLKKLASRVLYRLSKKNQVIFSTHEPEMLFNFNSKQIKQVVLDNSYSTNIKKHTNVDEILDDLGFTANDLLNVSFVFIVEGKQDRSRLPILLKHYYSEIVTDDGELKRVSIIATNSCTNIKTYANLKYINSLYLKDQFMLIRDGDGKDSQELCNQLTGYYKERLKHDKGKLPRVTEDNVLILKYYSFENYFLFPEVMAKIGVVESVDEFYDILWAKYKEYLYKLSSTKNMLEKCKFKINSRNDLIEHIEDIRIYVRGHNLFDIFYGRYKKNENEILTKYIEEAPPEVFGDILDKINNVVFFQSKKKV
ncbi:MAG: ATP-dependent nuclease [Lachnospira sp.]